MSFLISTISKNGFLTISFVPIYVKDTERENEASRKFFGLIFAKSIATYTQIKELTICVYVAFPTGLTPNKSD